MAEYPLKTLLALRRREEDVASEAWANALGARQQAEAEAARMEDELRAIQERLAAGRAADVLAAARSASEVTSAARFESRLRDELARATGLRESHRRGPLARACAAEESARQEVVERRRAREALETHDEQFRDAERRQAERRADEENDEHARLIRHDRQPRPDPEG